MAAVGPRARGLGAGRRPRGGRGSDRLSLLILGLTELFSGHCDYGAAGHAANQHLPGVGMWFVVLAPVVGALLYGPLVARFAPEARGHGVPEVMLAVAERGGRIRPQVPVVKALASALCIGSGGSVGREGPIVQIGSALGSVAGQLARLPPRRLRLLVACGAAGCIAATFNAPIAGVFFALEVILGDFETQSFGVVVLSSVTASALARAVFGSDSFLHLPSFTLVSPFELVLYAELGALAGAIGVLFIRVLYGTEDLADRLWRGPAWARRGGWPGRPSRLSASATPVLGVRSVGRSCVRDNSTKSCVSVAAGEFAKTRWCSPVVGHERHGRSEGAQVGPTRARSWRSPATSAVRPDSGERGSGDGPRRAQPRVVGSRADGTGSRGRRDRRPSTGAVEYTGAGSRSLPTGAELRGFTAGPWPKQTRRLPPRWNRPARVAAHVAENRVVDAMAAADLAATANWEPVGPAMCRVGVQGQREAADHRRTVNTRAGLDGDRALRREEGRTLVPQERRRHRRKVPLLEPDRRPKREEPTHGGTSPRHSGRAKRQQRHHRHQDLLDQMQSPPMASRTPCGPRAAAVAARPHAASRLPPYVAKPWRDHRQLRDHDEIILRAARAGGGAANGCDDSHRRYRRSTSLGPAGPAIRGADPLCRRGRIPISDTQERVVAALEGRDGD